jgi:hypothetical protein
MALHELCQRRLHMMHVGDRLTALTCYTVTTSANAAGAGTVREPRLSNNPFEFTDPD